MGSIAMGTEERDPGSALVSNQRLLTTKAPKMEVAHVLRTRARNGPRNKSKKGESR